MPLDCGAQRALQEVFEVTVRGLVSLTSRQRLTEAIKKDVPLNVSISLSQPAPLH